MSSIASISSSARLGFLQSSFQSNGEVSKAKTEGFEKVKTGTLPGGTVVQKSLVRTEAEDPFTFTRETTKTSPYRETISQMLRKPTTANNMERTRTMTLADGTVIERSIAKTQDADGSTTLMRTITKTTADGEVFTKSFERVTTANSMEMTRTMTLIDGTVLEQFITRTLNDDGSINISGLRTKTTPDGESYEKSFEKVIASYGDGGISLEDTYLDVTT